MWMFETIEPSATAVPKPVAQSGGRLRSFR